MSDNPAEDLVNQQDWLKPLSEKSDALVDGALGSLGEAGEAAKDALVNSRLLGHTQHPTITDVPFGAWTVTLIADLLEMAGHRQSAKAGDLSVSVGVVSSILASAGGLADLSETHKQADRQLGAMHGVLQGVAILLYGSSWAARRARNRGLGRILSVVGYATQCAATYLANELREKRERES